MPAPAETERIPQSDRSKGTVAFGKFVIVAAELALLVIVLRQFEVESAAFLRVALLAFGGFAIHAFLPFPMRLPFFAVLSLTGIVVVFGAVESAWLIGIGLVLIGVCHLPVSLGARVALLVIAGSVLAAERIGWVSVPWSRAIVPIVASMFMFRVIVYLYDLHHDRMPVSAWRTLSYFFLLPNVCFPLFPVIDYKTFRRNYYDDDAYRIYQVGVGWMVRGVLHLIIYRFIYYYMTLAPREVAGAVDLGQYVVSNFLLYLRLSGQFHLIVGMLYLFGFRLPETHHLYLLASSFTDFWRRINIYWKDFMLKLVYYPAYFRLRAWGPTRALVASTVLVFVMTWFLHAYQWFWLRGSFLLAWPDIAFWSILAGLVVINSLWETKYGRARSLKKSTRTPAQTAALALRTVGTFASITILWSLWTSESIAAWWELWKTAGRQLTLPSTLSSALLVAGVAVVGTGVGPVGGIATGATSGLSRLRRSTAVTVFLLATLALTGIPAVYSLFGPGPATVIHSLRTGKLNRVDTAMLERGYYEDLLRVERFNSELWQVYMKKPNKILDVQGTGLDRFTGDFLQKELMPSTAASTRHGLIRTNRWGLRDQDYEKKPPPGTYRVAMLGASSVMGWGINDGETFEALLEDRLNRDRPYERYAKYEILNFAAPGYQPLQQLMVLDKAFAFSPTAVYYVATGREASRAADYLAEVVRKRIPIPYDYLRDTAKAAGIDPTTEETLALRRLAPFQVDILTWLYRRIVEQCRDRGVVPVLVFLPQVNDGAWREETPTIIKTARDAGFVVIDLDDVYRNHDITSIRLAEWDNHPNATGHRLVAERLYRELLARDNQIFSSARHTAEKR